MARCWSWWKYLHVICFTLQSVKAVPKTHSSKACYGVAGLSCTRHYLSCRLTQNIAITDVYYTSNTECSASGLSSCSVIPESVKVDGYLRFINTELAPIYIRCSMQTECVYSAPRRGAGRTFSVVKYQCIEKIDSLGLDGGMAKGISQVSVMSGDKWRQLNSSTLKASRCWLQPTGMDVDITVYTLDARLRRDSPSECLSQPNVETGNIITVTTCNNLYQPFEKLNISQDLPKSITFLDAHKRKTILWLLINATSPFNITCEHTPVQTKGTCGVTTMASYNISSKRTTEGILHTTEVPDGTNANVGGIVGGVAVIVFAASVTAFFIVRLIRKRGRNVQETERDTHSLREVKTDNTYCLARNFPQTVKPDADLKAQNSASDCDYATADSTVPQSDTYATCDRAASVAESDYNLIDDKPSPLTAEYDTTSTVRQSIHTGEHIREDEFGYNLFQKTNIKTLLNDYDTAASATKAVAQMSGIDRNTDDDYDHFSRATDASETLGSPYDTVGNM